MPDLPWLTPEELAERWQIPVGTIYAWRYKGVGPRAHKIGRHLRYRLDDVEDWEASQAMTPAAS